MSTATQKDPISLHARTLAGTGRVNPTAKQSRRFRKNLHRTFAWLIQDEDE